MAKELTKYQSQLLDHFKGISKLNELMENNKLEKVKEILLKEGTTKEVISGVENKYKIELSNIIEKVRRIEEKKEEIEDQLNGEIDIKEIEAEIKNLTIEKGNRSEPGGVFYDEIKNDFNDWEYEIKDKEILEFIKENGIKELTLNIGINIEDKEIESEGIFEIIEKDEKIKIIPSIEIIKEVEKKIEETLLETIEEDQNDLMR
jgi:hypothetical protein